MSERDALLAAIKADWDDDTPRLVYADWLDEHGAGDLDAATVEFIRLSCDSREGGRKGKPQPRAAYGWIEANWRRLVPSVVALHMSSGAAPVAGERDGRRVKARIRLLSPAAVPTSLLTTLEDGGTGPTVLYTARFSFRRGLCETAHVYSVVARDAVRPALLRDQPLALLIVGD